MRFFYLNMLSHYSNLFIFYFLFFLIFFYFLEVLHLYSIFKFITNFESFLYMKFNYIYTFFKYLLYLATINNCNFWIILCVMPWSRDGHVILILIHPSLSTKLLQVPRRCYPHFSCIDLDITYSCIDLDITFYISTLALSGEKVLSVLQSQGQAVCLMTGLREKTTYRLAPFWIRWWWSKKVLYAL